MWVFFSFKMDASACIDQTRSFSSLPPVLCFGGEEANKTAAEISRTFIQKLGVVDILIPKEMAFKLGDRSKTRSHPFHFSGKVETATLSLVFSLEFRTNHGGMS